MLLQRLSTGSLSNRAADVEQSVHNLGGTSTRDTWRKGSWVTQLRRLTLTVSKSTKPLALSFAPRDGSARCSFWIYLLCYRWFWLGRSSVVAILLRAVVRVAGESESCRHGTS